MNLAFERNMIPSYQGHDAKQDDKGRIGRTLHGRDTRFSSKKSTFDFQI